MRLCVMICWRWFTHHHQSFNQGFRKYDGAPTLIADPPAPVHCADTSEDWSRGSHDKVPPPIDVTFSECSWNNWCIRRFDTYTDTLYLEWVSLKWAEMTVWCLVASTSKSLEQFRESNVTFWIYIMSWRQHWQKKTSMKHKSPGPVAPAQFDCGEWELCWKTHPNPRQHKKQCLASLSTNAKVQDSKLIFHIVKQPTGSMHLKSLNTYSRFYNLSFLVEYINDNNKTYHMYYIYIQTYSINVRVTCHHSPSLCTLSAFQPPLYMRPSGQTYFPVGL